MKYYIGLGKSEENPDLNNIKYIAESYEILWIHSKSNMTDYYFDADVIGHFYRFALCSDCGCIHFNEMSSRIIPIYPEPF